MSYMRGGGYYRGDPGFFGFLGGLAKTALGFIPGVGPALSSLIPAGEAAAKLPQLTAGASRIGQLARPGVQSIRAIGRGVMRHPVLTGAAAAAGAAAAGAGIAHHLMAGGGKKHRRMHVTNVKALRRAIRRAKGFEKIARRVLHFTSPRRVGGRGFFKFKRKKRSV